MTAIGRRDLLVAAAGLTGASLLGAACSGSPGTPGDEQALVTTADRLEGDLAVAALLASMENLLVAVYQDGIDRREKLGPYPPATVAMIENAQRQHKEHATAWNSILTGAGKPGVTGVNLTVKAATTDPQLFRAKDGTALLTVCQDLEALNGITYLAAIGALQNNAALKVAASIHPVEQEHVGVLAFLLGRTLAPESFGRTDGARPTTDSIG